MKGIADSPLMKGENLERQPMVLLYKNSNTKTLEASHVIDRKKWLPLWDSYL